MPVGRHETRRLARGSLFTDADRKDGYRIREPLEILRAKISNRIAFLDEKAGVIIDNNISRLTHTW